MIRKDNNNNKKTLKWGLNPQEKKCSIYWSLAYLAQSKGIMWLLLCSERLWLDSFWHNRLAYWNRNITVRWICSWLQKRICLNRNVPCNSLKPLLWAWKLGLLGRIYSDILVLGSQDARASGDTGVVRLEKGPVFMSPFQLTMQCHSPRPEAGCTRKAGSWDVANWGNGHWARSWICRSTVELCGQLSPRAGFENTSMPGFHLCGHTEYRFLSDNHH